MPTNIRIRRGKKANLPKSAPSGMPLWCEDTKELYIGTQALFCNPQSNSKLFQVQTQELQPMFTLLMVMQ